MEVMTAEVAMAVDHSLMVRDSPTVATAADHSPMVDDSPTVVAMEADHSPTVEDSLSVAMEVAVVAMEAAVVAMEATTADQHLPATVATVVMVADHRPTLRDHSPMVEDSLTVATVADQADQLLLATVLKVDTVAIVRNVTLVLVPVPSSPLSMMAVMVACSQTTLLPSTRASAEWPSTKLSLTNLRFRNKR